MDSDWLYAGKLVSSQQTAWNQQCLLTFSWRCSPTAKIHCATSLVTRSIYWKAVLVSLTSQSHFILFLHKPGHDQCFLVWRTGSDWTAKLKQAEVLCCQKNHSEMKCCCHGLCDVWHVLLANPLWLQGLDAVHYMFRHTPSATQQHNYDVLYNSAGMSWSSSGFIWGHKAERFQWDRWNCM